MTVCYFCRKSWCACNKVCDLDCQLRNAKTAKFDFCGTCKKALMDEFEKQFHKPRLRLEAR